LRLILENRTLTVTEGWKTSRRAGDCDAVPRRNLRDQDGSGMVL
jgi:hypothetical protein